MCGGELFLSAFKILCLCFFEGLIIMCLSVNLFEFILWRFVELLGFLDL